MSVKCGKCNILTTMAEAVAKCTMRKSMFHIICTRISPRANHVHGSVHSAVMMPHLCHLWRRTAMKTEPPERSRGLNKL